MEDIDLREVFNFFKAKVKYMIVFILAVVILGNILMFFMREPLYHSNTTVVLISDNNSTVTSSDIQLSKNLVNTYSEIVKSRKVLNQVIENLKLKCSVYDLANSINVTSVENTEIIEIEVSDRDNKLAVKIADEIADVFSKEIQQIYNLKNVSIVDKAVVETIPYNINYVKENIIYLLIGTVFSCGIVFILYYFDTSIKSAELVEEKLGLTVLGIVPKED
ncbi:MAG: hypothetical protein J6B89_02670 [Bacilli bacterium]|nr:hypothetical protein [Bacilli bacterium]